MDVIVTAIIITGLIGFIAAIVLVAASKLMYVKVDEKVAQLREALPGANCGACGFPGCDGYAEAVAKGDAAPDLCTPGGAAVYSALAGIIGAGNAPPDGASSGAASVRKVAIVQCAGDYNSKSEKMEYTGISSCLASEQFYGGQNACSFGCLGFGDCISACPVSAICIADGLAHVDTSRCISCGKCVKACPRGVITMMTETVNTVVMCRNTEKGAAVRNKCKKGCIACTKCVRECPAKAIEITDFLAGIDPAKCDGCGRCVKVCMTGCIGQLFRGRCTSR